jgi:superfamily II DNA or RNA helicase
VPASLFTDVVKHFDCRFMLGLSATAFRRDGLTRVIHFYLGERSHRVDPGELHQSGAVLKPKFIQRPTSFKYVYRGNYQALLKSLTKNTERNRQIVDDIAHEAKAADGAILVVSDRIEHCEELAAQLKARGFPAVVLTGKTPPDERTQAVADLQHGRIKILVSTVQLIGEGFDCQGLETLFLTTPIKFSGRLLQVVGRILRPAAGKQPRVYDYVDPVSVLKSSAQSRQMTYLL